MRLFGLYLLFSSSDSTAILLIKQKIQSQKYFKTFLMIKIQTVSNIFAKFVRLFVVIITAEKLTIK